MIIKSKTFKNFTIINNDIVKDETLSFKAKGVYLLLSSFPEDWIIHKSNLHKYSSDGQDAVRSAFNELVDNGLILAVKKVNDKGQFEGWDYIVYPEKQENPIAEKPIWDNPRSDNPESNNKEYSNIDLTNKDLIAADAAPEKSDYVKSIEVYNEFIKKLSGGAGAKIDGQQGKAMKSIIAYMKTQLKESGSDVSESLKVIFERWNKLEPFIQKQTTLSQISSNLQNIIIQLKNGATANNTGTVGRINKDELRNFMQPRGKSQQAGIFDTKKQ